MEAHQNRNTVVAIVPEDTEGVLKAPGAATDFVAIQDDFDISPAFDLIQNKELRSSIGRAKPFLGAENPEASFSHYLRHSGVEGQAPNYKTLLDALFGTSALAGTEYDTIAGSTVSLVKVDAGEGVNFGRGHILLIKDPVNVYSIRPVHSVSTDNLTPGFNLANAPGTAVKLGKAASFKPANKDHKTYSIWRYGANGAVIEAIAGARSTSWDVDFPAGKEINQKFSIAANEYFYNPVILAATDTKLDFLDDAATRVATVKAGVYKDPHDLAAAIQTAMNSLGSANAFTCAYSDSTGKFTLTSSGTTFTLKWNTGANAANTVGDKIGFVISADDSGALTYTSDNALSFAAPYTPSLDAADPLVAKANEIFLGEATDSAHLASGSVKVSVKNATQDLEDVGAVSGRAGSLISERDGTISIQAYLKKYDVDKFKRFREGTTTRFAYNFGVKSGGNWVAGKCGCLYVPTATISKFKMTPNGGILMLDIELSPYVDENGNGEIYLGFV